MSLQRDSWCTLTLAVPAEAGDDLDGFLALAAAQAGVALRGAAMTGTEADTGQDVWVVYTDTEEERGALEGAFAGAAELLEWPADRLPTVRGRGLQLREPWHEAWREHFQPVDIDGRIRIVPPWLRAEGENGRGGEGVASGGAGEKRQHGGWRSQAADEAGGMGGKFVGRGAIEVVIDPGMAFGTGTHATTQLVLLMLADLLVPAGGDGRVYETILDVGTGSSILAIAALKLGAGRVTATDLDPDVAPNVIDNLRLNGFLEPGEDVVDPVVAQEILSGHPRLRLHLGPLTDGVLGPGLDRLAAPWCGPFDLILCNMLQHEFTPLLPTLASLLGAAGSGGNGAGGRGGRILLSGFLLRDQEEVKELVRGCGLEVVGEVLAREDWGGMVCGRG